MTDKEWIKALRKSKRQATRGSATVYVYYDFPFCKSGRYDGQEGRDVKKKIRKYVGKINNKLFKHIPLTEDEQTLVNEYKEFKEEKNYGFEGAIFHSVRRGWCVRDAVSPRIKLELI